jgi:anionic cell wall polymer biosynthesis LytR-Cps2A-Psr (LCP) family protein
MKIALLLTIPASFLIGAVIENSVESGYRTSKIISPVTASIPSYTTFGTILGTMDLKMKEPVENDTRETITLLLLGLDSRKNQKSTRCDSINLIQYGRKSKSVRITNIPRGTPVALPGMSEEGAIIANACSVAGIDYTVGQIEKIAKVKTDYIATVGFSQTMGILRNLNLPPSETLQSLRNRAYGLGDNQRGFNQAQFLKDAVTNHIQEIGRLPKTVRYILYRMIDTDMDFETADRFLMELAQSGVDRDPSKINVVSLSPYANVLKEIHVEDLVKTKPVNTSDPEYQDYQLNLTDYLNSLIERNNQFLKAKNFSAVQNQVARIIDQQLWLQIDDTPTRNKLQLDLLKLYVASFKNPSEKTSMILDYSSQMEEEGNTDLKQEADKFLQEILSN